MKQTEREQKNTQVTKENEIKESGAAQRPRSWREYIEETERAEKQAELEAAKAQAVKTKGKKNKRQRRQATEQQPVEAKAAALPAVRKEEAKADPSPVKEKAAQAVKALGAAGNESWKRVCDFTANGWDRAGKAMGKVREVVDRHPVSPLLYVTLLAVFIGTIVLQNQYSLAYAMNVNEQERGAVYTADEDEAADAVDELSDAVLIEEDPSDGEGAWIQGYELRVNGGLLGYAADSADLYQLLDEAAQPYLSENTIRYEFVEDVEVRPVQLPPETQFNVETIRNVLQTMQVEEAVYVVQKGDTFNAIAYSLDMWPYELSILNPDVIVNKIWVGQELIIQEAVPYLSVEMVTDETYEDVIPSPVEYIETADLYVGDTKVKEQGEDGLALVNANVTFVNGVEVKRDIIESTVLKEATTTIAYSGTSPRPITASNGYYIWPVRGTITSNFGGRNLWGTYDFHLGLDIACPMGTTIKASDGGTVIKAGWSGSYGNLVAIRHDNGTVTYYAHNSSILVSVGQKVYQGQAIAKAGMTGNASGPHCHFEVRINGTSVNPRNYLS